MRFGLTHRLMTDALAVLGVLALVTSGKLDPFATSLLLAGLGFGLLLPDRFKSATYLRLLGAVLPVGLLALQLGRLLVGSEPIPVIVEFAAALQVIRLATRRGAAHDHQVILLALLHLIAGTVLGGGLTYAIALIGFLVLTPGALVLSHLRREVEGNYRQGARDRTGMPVDVPRILRSRRVIHRGFLIFTCLLSVPVFALTALLFLAFPRVGFTWLVVSPIQPSRVVGFSDRVDLGGVGTIRTDPTLVMRVVPGVLPAEPPLRKNLYLKGAAFDRYDGSSWERVSKVAHRQSSGASLVPLVRYPEPGDGVWQIELEPIQPPVVFLPSETVAFEVTEQNRRPGRLQPLIQIGSHGEIEYSSSDQSGLNYRVYVAGPRPVRRPEGEALRPYLQVPPHLSDRVRQLAALWANGLEDPQQIAERVQTKLRSEYRYDLSSPSGGAADPLDHFLFESKAGHCEFYSTAMAVLLRTLDIPTRNVTGFVGGTYNRFGGFYAVRQGDAHSWVEVFLPEVGWTRFDPTPPAVARPQGESQTTWATLRELVEAAAQGWDRHVVGFDLNQQLAILNVLKQKFAQAQKGERSGGSSISLRQGVIAGASLLLVGVIFRWLWRRRRPQIAAVVEQRNVARSIELYARLERALELQGLKRLAATPPLAHARALVQAGHPVGPQALLLTELYMRARYAHIPLTNAEEEDFVRRTRALAKLDLTEKGAPRAA